MAKHLGPVDQSIVSLTSSLRDQLYDFITQHTDFFFFVVVVVVTLFQQKILAYLRN